MIVTPESCRERSLTTTATARSLSRRTARTLPAGQTESYTYNAVSKMATHVDFEGKTTTAATIPLATRDAVESGKLQKSDIVIFAAVGAGFTVGAN